MTKGELKKLLDATKLPDDADVLFCWPGGDQACMVPYLVEREDDHASESCFARVYLEVPDERVDKELSWN